MTTLESKFEEMKFDKFSNNQILKGYLKICQLQGANFYIKITWELLTTFIVYSPSINNFVRDMIKSIKNKWVYLSRSEQENVIAALIQMNKHGKIERALSKY